MDGWGSLVMGAIAIRQVAIPPKEQGIGSFQVGGGMAMQLFVRHHHPVIAAAIEGDVDRVSERSHTLLPLLRSEIPGGP